MLSKKKENENTWLSSKETIKELKISDCDLMHLRTAGKLEFRKERNAFFYLVNDIAKIKAKHK